MFYSFSATQHTDSEAAVTVTAREVHGPASRVNPKILSLRGRIWSVILQAGGLTGITEEAF